MNKEKLINLNMKDVILDKWKSKKGYILNNKDLEELKNIIDYYEQENKTLHNKIDKAIKYVSQLSSKGRDCEIYWDIKQEILKILKESDVDA